MDKAVSDIIKEMMMTNSAKDGPACSALVLKSWHLGGL
jgi:hypothetical protein